MAQLSYVTSQPGDLLGYLWRESIAGFGKYLYLLGHGRYSERVQTLRIVDLGEKKMDHLYVQYDRRDKVGFDKVVRTAEEVRCTGFAVD